VVVAVACAVASSLAHGVEPRAEGFERWRFLIGEWKLTETRQGFDGKLIETIPGHAMFSYAMNEQRIQELQFMEHGADTTTALQLFAYDPGAEKVEIVRTDSSHLGFWVIVGTLSDDRMDLVEKHPDPESQVTRRITYLRDDDDHFLRQLEFSQDRGKSWFVRSEWRYERTTSR